MTDTFGRTHAHPRLGPRAAVVLLLLLASTLTASCGGSDEPTSEATTSEATTSDAATGTPPTPTDLDGTTYESTSVTGHDLVAGSRVVVAFQDDTLAVSAGCNTIAGAFSLENGLLRWTGAPMTTLMACDSELEAQDVWLTALFTTGLVASGDATALTLRKGDIVLELAAQGTADLSSLLGRTWTVVATMVDGQAQRTPSGLRNPRLTVGSDGLSRLFTGCNAGRTVVRVDGDNLVFGPTTSTRRACQEPERTIERRVLAVLDGPADSVQAEGQVLIVTKGSEGLVFNVR